MTEAGGGAARTGGPAAGGQTPGFKVNQAEKLAEAGAAGLELGEEEFAGALRFGLARGLESRVAAGRC